MASARLRAHIGVWGGAPSGMPPVGSQEAKPPEAECSVAFKAPVEEPNLTLVVDSFLPCNRAGFRGGQGARPQASHHRGSSHQTAHILFLANESADDFFIDA